MSVPPQAIAPNPHTNLLNVNIQVANKMEFQQKKNFLKAQTVATQRPVNVQWTTLNKGTLPEDW
jgi:hypothetical protein